MSHVVHIPVVRSRVAHGPCVVCEGTGARPYFMTFGVVIALCKVHRELSYLRRRSGRVFGDQLRRHFHARFGFVSTRQHAAIQAHIGSVSGTNLTAGPGSYSWPTVRLEAEQRFAAGHDPHVVIAQLRRRYSGSTAIVPSVRTLQRWFNQGRWLADPNVWRQLFREGRRRRNRRVVDYIGGPTLTEAIFQPTKAWSRMLNPWYPSEDNFTVRA